MKHIGLTTKALIVLSFSLSSLSAIQVIYPQTNKPLNQQKVHQLKTGSINNNVYNNASLGTQTVPPLGLYQAVTGETVENTKIIVPNVPPVIMKEGYIVEPTKEEQESESLKKQRDKEVKEELEKLEKKAKEEELEKLEKKAKEEENKKEKTHSLDEEARKELDEKIKNSTEEEKKLNDESEFNLFT